MKKSRGFTIIELSVAIFILSVGIIGVYNAFSSLVVFTSSSSDRFVASYLAQEGIEIIRNIRDNNWVLLKENWKSGLADEDIDCSTGCQADYKTMGTAFSPLAPYVSDGDYIKIDNDGFYSYSSGQPTKFKRKITITPLAGQDYVMKASVEVFWDEKPSILNPSSQPGSIKVEEVLYNWY